MTLQTDDKMLGHKSSEMERERREQKHNYIFPSQKLFFSVVSLAVQNFALQSSLLTGNVRYIFNYMKDHGANTDILLSTASLRTHKSHELQKKKCCRFSKWRRSAWATVSWNSTAVRRGVCRTEGGEQLTLCKKTVEDRCRGIRGQQ